MDLNNCGFIDPQGQLSAALAKRDIREFHTALDNGAQANLPDERHTTLYEKALSTPECAQFIEACLSHGCNVNYINQKLNKAAISYAADSRDPSNLAVLLRHGGVQVDRKYGQLTPLNSLAKNLTAENASQVGSCIQLLLEYGASPNVVDQGEFTPLHHVLKNRKIEAGTKQELIRLFLTQPQLDIDSYRNGQVRQMLKDQYPDLQLPEMREAGAEIDCERLLRTLRDGDETQFEQQFAEYHQNLSGNADNQRNANQEEYLSLLVESIKRGKQRALEAILETGININPTKLNATSPVELAVIWGNHRALEKLLKHPQLRLTSNSKLLNAVISRLDEQPLDDFCDHQRCFQLLLESDRVDINEADKGGQVPLSYAVKYRNTKVAQELLRQGAYIGARSAFGELPIQEMDPKVLEEHFDSCITTNGEKPGDQGFEIVINYKNLMRRERESGQSTIAHPHQLQDEMTPIAYIAETKELRHLLQHPLISSFLFLKWHRLSVIFYLNFLLYSLFTASIITHTLLKFHESDHTALTALFGLFSWIGIVYLIIREVIQFAMSPLLHFWSITNLMEVALIVLSILTCMEASYDKETQRVLAVFTILLVSLEFCLLVGSLPVLSISTHMLMLRAVSSSFIKSFALYSIFVLTFSLCFYILFGKPQVDQKDSPPEPVKEGEDDGHFNTFSVPIEALIKTIVMLTGEFDAGDIKFDSVYTYLIFLLFVFFMTIVLFNLLNGLAVSDTQAIKAQAELNGAIVRTNLLTRYEQVLTGRDGHAGFIVGSEPFRSICQRLMNIYPNYLSLRQISVLPNDGNKVLIPMSDGFELQPLNGKSPASFQQLPTSATQKKLLDPPLRLMPCCCSVLTGKCSQIDGRTVKLALAVIDQKSNAEQRRQRDQISDRRLQIIEHKLENLQFIEQKLDHLLQVLQERT
ncbi:transient receptor potential cation channel protein painless [Drosophila obscura]|uniref:transient receptor potential cation channel protein painless n=1 Tax=Drosophila obscura TaxID=7282 RepID=UPI001BB171DD|nr:transient receptor potential cation channel protein painless [Drosophila obscura]